MKKIIISMLVLSLALALGACTATESNAAVETTTEQTSSTAQATESEVATSAADDVEEGYLAGQRALDFELQDLAGNAVKLSDYRGKTVVLNFFATWCGPCQVETPHLNETYLDMQDEDVVVLAVNLTFSRGSEKDDVAEFVKEYDVAFPVLLDEMAEVSDMYRVRSIPTNIFIKPDGIIYNSFSGALNKEGFIEMIEGAKSED